MLQCFDSASSSSPECAEYEEAGVEFVNRHLTPPAFHLTEAAFPNLGHPGKNGSFTFAALDGAAGPDWVIVAVTAAVVAAAVLVVVGLALLKSRAQQRPVSPVA